ncbi:MAG: hypothetical protein AAF517_15580 [Planctomycetota bacterium]
MHKKHRCNACRGRREILGFLSENCERWIRYAKKSRSEKGRGALVVRSFCSCCGRANVGYATASQNECIAEMLDADGLHDGLLICITSPAQSALAFHRFSFSELRGANATALN